ncbi:hypothetical protein F5B21DRAFT_510116 [Xylaria acuta]|nr:hypothetical protein F5B21DRAFT_510116 [Xylaria acuta]
MAESQDSFAVSLEWREGHALLFCNKTHCNDIIRNTITSLEKHLCTYRCNTNPDQIRKTKEWLIQEEAFHPEDPRNFPRWLNDIRFEQPVEPLPMLQTISGEYLGCSKCSYAVKALNKMKKHYKNEHPGPVPERFSHCNVQFFQCGQQIRHFQVTGNSQTTVNSAGTLLTRHLHDETPNLALVSNVGIQQEPNKWLERLKFNVHLEGFDLAIIVQLLNVDQCPELSRATSHMKAMAWRSREILAKAAVDSQTLMQQLNRRKYSDASHSSFNWDIENDTLQKYLKTWEQILTYVERLYNWEYDFSPPCTLTPDQTQAMDNLLSLDWTQATDEIKDATIFDLLWAISSHRIRRDPFQNVMVSACAIFGVDHRDVSWRTAMSYESKHFSAIIKIFLYLLYLRASTAVDDQQKGIAPTWTRMDQFLPKEKFHDDLEALTQMMQGVVYVG